ncbi:hypothetical protein PAPPERLAPAPP_03320 [Brevundimonas phage vB_BpoS-Papperlapapp]|uniref:Uncharacterized protein n=1 Tax=Brevundimonas phage vB_BpoS-Domovoi TaxID=2948598 RepID=A0A9E7MPW2_9CAUD|nr:hypothetical protein DOMOVOI_02270 [Brevundimonas phage vB_BpoS-Domovoi]USN16073.1 hypothetical protein PAPPERLAPAPP_03320 [Brevundimonas phage vB_BpoS-Papperlapapp]UTC29287.1 hypothetical protein BAMBUS_02050 [Brevundimonas phage vB_BpoS-Bambus]
MHVLKLLESGNDPSWVPLVNGRGSQSRTVGRGATLSAAERAGFIVWQGRNARLAPGEPAYILTRLGRREILAEEGRVLERVARQARKDLMRGAHWERGHRCHGLWSNTPVIDLDEPRNTREAPRLGRVSIGPSGLWDGKTYAWLIDNPAAPGGPPLAEGEAPSLREAKAAVELGVGRLRRGLPCTT